MLEGPSPAHLVLILVIALVVLGPGKLPEAGAALGRALHGFRDAMDGKDEAAAADGDRASSDAPRTGPDVTTA